MRSGSENRTWRWRAEGGNWTPLETMMSLGKTFSGWMDCKSISIRKTFPGKLPGHEDALS